AVLRRRVRGLAHRDRPAAADRRRHRRADDGQPRRAPAAERGRRMIVLVDGLLWAIALALGIIAARRSRLLLRDSVREGVIDCARLIPRIMLGVVGSGYIAALLPEEVVGRWLGAD